MYVCVCIYSIQDQHDQHPLAYARIHTTAKVLHPAHNLFRTPMYMYVKIRRHPSTPFRTPAH